MRSSIISSLGLVVMVASPAFSDTITIYNKIGIYINGMYGLSPRSDTIEYLNSSSANAFQGLRINLGEVYPSYNTDGFDPGITTRAPFSEPISTFGRIKITFWNYSSDSGLVLQIPYNISGTYWKEEGSLKLQGFDQGQIDTLSFQAFAKNDVPGSSYLDFNKYQLSYVYPDQLASETNIPLSIIRSLLNFDNYTIQGQVDEATGAIATYLTIAAPNSIPEPTSLAIYLAILGGSMLYKRKSWVV